MPNSNYSEELWKQIMIQAELNMLSEERKCSLYRRIYIPMQVRNGGYSELSKEDKMIFLQGVSDGSWDKGGNHIGNNSNPYIQSKNRISD